MVAVHLLDVVTVGLSCLFLFLPFSFSLSLFSRSLSAFRSGLSITRRGCKCKCDVVVVGELMDAVVYISKYICRCDFCLSLLQVDLRIVRMVASVGVGVCRWRNLIVTGNLQLIEYGSRLIE